jgi:hypothetical protein
MFTACFVAIFIFAALLAWIFILHLAFSGTLLLPFRYIYFSQFQKEKFDYIWKMLTKSLEPTLGGKMAVADIAVRLCNKKFMDMYFKSVNIQAWTPEIDWRMVMIAYVGYVGTRQNVSTTDLYNKFNNFVYNLAVRAGLVKFA